MHNQIWLVSQKETMRNAYSCSDPIITLEGHFGCSIWCPPIQDIEGLLNVLKNISFKSWKHFEHCLIGFLPNSAVSCYLLGL